MRRAEPLARVDHWRVVTQLQGAPTVCELRPDDTLRWHDEAEGGVWEANGDHAGFQLGIPYAESALPAGWYVLRGRIERLDGTLTLPSLRAVYMDDTAADDGEAPLPDSEASGRLHALVLFRYPVASLHFCPGVLASRFRMHEFSLRRVSRLRALWMMLNGSGQHLDSRTTLRHAARFLTAWRTVGLRPATEAAFGDYLEHQRPPGLTDYDVWMRKYDTLTPGRLSEFRRRGEAIANGATSLSVLMPVRGMPVDSLRRSLDSMRAQLWSGWELCVAFDASCDASIRGGSAEYAANDPRIRVATDVEKDAVAAFNRTLAMAAGSHVVVVGAEVELRRHALLEMADLRRRHPDVAFAYSDEDCIDAEGRRLQPYFKPDWNPDLLRSQDYVGPFAMIRTDLMRAVGGMRLAQGDNALYDLYLRCTEHTERTRIRHIPHVLYHRQTKIPAGVAAGAAAGAAVGAAEAATTELLAMDGALRSVANRGDQSPECPDGARIVADHLARLAIDAEVETCPGETFHVHWPLPTPRPNVSVVIPTRDKVDLLRTCVESVLAKTIWPNLEIIVVDNQSSERRTLDYLEALRSRERVRVLRDDAPFNYAAINNRAVAQCDSELVCLLNNDIEVISPHWLEEMAGHALRPKVGAVGAMLYYPNDTIQHAGVVVGLHGMADHVYSGRPRGWPGHGGRARVAQEMSAVTAACLLVRRATWLEVDGLDVRLPVAFNDVDFCLRLLEHGYHNVWTPHAELYHHESASRGQDVSPEQQARNAAEIAYMRERWPAVLRADPAWNPNLSLRATGSELAFPPRLGGESSETSLPRGAGQG